MNLKIIVSSQKKPDRKEATCYNSGEMKLQDVIYSDRKQVSSCFRTEEGRGEREGL